MNPTQNAGTISMRKFFSYQGQPVRNLNDFWGWRADQITEDLKKKLKELRDFMTELRQNKNANQPEMAGKLSESLKSFAAKNGINLKSASFDDMKKLEKMLQDQIIERLKPYAARAVDQSQDNKVKNTAHVTGKKEISLSEPVFQTKTQQALLDPSKNIRQKTDNIAKTSSVYCEPQTNNSWGKNIEISA